MKKKVNGHRKGSKFERDISKQISSWFTKGERDDLLWRTAGSGARQTTRQKKGLQTEGHAGDIASTSAESKILTDVFCFELKNYADINPWQLIVGENKLVTGWWDELIVTTQFEDKLPCLIIKQDYKPPIFISDNIFSNFFSKTFSIDPTCILNMKGNTLCIYPLEIILEQDVDIFKIMLHSLKSYMENPDG